MFFAQSSLVHLDLAAAGLTFWGLRAYMKGRGWDAALWFSLASLTKETAILAPLALFAWELLSRALADAGRKDSAWSEDSRNQSCFWSR